MNFHVLSAKASAALARGRAVVLNGSAELTYPLVNGGQVMGILATDTAQGAMGDVYVLGECPIGEAGEAFAIGDMVKASIATGKLVKAAATRLMDSDNLLSDVTLTAKKAYQGAIGNTISCTFTDPAANNRPLGVTVSDFDINVTLKTGAAGAIESKASEIAAAINAHAEASLLVTAAPDGAGSGVVKAIAKTYLFGGHGAFARARDAATANGDYIAVELFGGGA